MYGVIVLKLFYVDVFDTSGYFYFYGVIYKVLGDPDCQTEALELCRVFFLFSFGGVRLNPLRSPVTL
jgi:hypothetical protein